MSQAVGVGAADEPISCAVFAGCRGMDGERMHAASQLGAKCVVDHAVAFEPALSAERFRHDIKTKVRFTSRPVSGVPRMQMGFVFDMQALGRESRNQFCRDDVLHSHFA